MRAFLKLLVAAALAPTAAGVLLAAARAMGALLARPADTQYFLIGCAAYPLLHAAAGFAPGGVRQWLYVLGHELTHAAAAWSAGFSVHALSVGSRGGHVKVSRSNLVVALAPYVVPLYALFVVAAYRVWTWRAGAAAPAWGRDAFLLALGAALSFHWTFTASALLTVRQPDLAAAGGTAFSLVLIALGNGLAVLGALKCLFPKLVSLSGSLGLAWRLSRALWTGAASLAMKYNHVR